MLSTKIKIVSSLEKPLAHESIDKLKPLRKITALKGERLSFQVAHTCHNDNQNDRGYIYASVALEGELAKYATMRDVCSVPVDRPTVQHSSIHDTNYISKDPGVFPDILRPLHNVSCICIANGHVMSMWVEINIPKRIKAGDYTVSVSVFNKNQELVAKESVTIEIIRRLKLHNLEFFLSIIHFLR